jgi:hypothetical protein
MKTYRLLTAIILVAAAAIAVAISGDSGLLPLDTRYATKNPLAVEYDFAWFTATGDIGDSGYNFETFSVATHEHTWDMILEKPDTFAPSSITLDCYPPVICATGISPIVSLQYDPATLRLSGATIGVATDSITVSFNGRSGVVSPLYSDYSDQYLTTNEAHVQSGSCTIPLICSGTAPLAIYLQYDTATLALDGNTIGVASGVYSPLAGSSSLVTLGSDITITPVTLTSTELAIAKAELMNPASTQVTTHLHDTSYLKRSDGDINSFAATVATTNDVILLEVAGSGYTKKKVLVNTGFNLAVGTTAGTVAAGDDSRFKVRSADTKTASYTVLTTDSGKVLIMNAAGTTTFSLPSVTAANIGIWFTFVKLGAGQLTIDAADSDIIVDSSAGGTIYNEYAAETWATITLILVSETKWTIIGALGHWTTN